MRTIVHKATRFIKRFILIEAAGGLLLMAGTLAAMLLVNSPWRALHAVFTGYALPALPGATVVYSINDGLMALFFLLVGLELKRELVNGQLATWEGRLLPLFAAVGGVVMPVVIFMVFNHAHPETLRAWAVPTPTDIAFALGILALLGSRVPLSLKILLTALTIVDDLIAIVLIALFYSESLSVTNLAMSAALVGVLAGLNSAGVVRMAPYLLVGGALWWFVHASGVHATLAGVMLAMAIPMGKPGAPRHASPLMKLEHRLHPWVAFGVLPLFGFANAAVPLAGVTWQSLTGPLSLGIILGLIIGKQVGIFGAVALCHVTGIARKPADISWCQLYAMAVLCGIGFTMSLFFGLLAFPEDVPMQNMVKIAVLVGSVISAIGGWLLLRATSPLTVLNRG